MKFVFIAVNYNGYEFTKSYIESIHQLKLNSIEDSVEIVIVDNNSKSDELGKIKLLNKELNFNLILLDENIGYFRGLNKGLAQYEDKRDILFIVGNNDLTFDKKFLLNLNNTSFAKDILVIAPDVITLDNRHQNPLRLKKISKISRLKDELYYSNYYISRFFSTLKSILTIWNSNNKSNRIPNKRMKIIAGIGACYILNNNFFSHYDKLDDRVFLWGEEALLSNQVEKVGGDIIFDPTLIVHHHESASVKKIHSRKKYEMVRNSYKIYGKYL